MKKTLALAVLLCLHTSALAAEPGPPAPLVEAIARQESGLNPLAVNIAGTSYYPATREEAERLIQNAIAAGQSFDVGTMQINSWWMERLAIDPFSLLDPATNERWGKWILAEEISLPRPGTRQTVRLACLSSLRGPKRLQNYGGSPCRAKNSYSERI